MGCNVDQISLLGIASASYQVIVKGFAAGRELENMSGDLSRWMGAISDIKQAEKISKNPPLFKKLFSGSSVEQEAMDAFAAKKKAEVMEEELRNFINLSYGPNAWQELLRMQIKIRKQRQETLYAQEEERRKLFERSVYVFIALILLAFLGWVGYLVTLKMESMT